MDARGAENRSSERRDRFRHLVGFPHRRSDQVRTPAPRDQRERAVVQNVPDPIPIRSVREREEELAVALEDVHGRSIRPA